MIKGFFLRSPWRPKGATRWILSVSPWLSASVIALALLCAVNLLFPGGRPPSYPFYGYLLALLLTLGLIHGALWSFAFWFVRRFLSRLAWLIWPALSLAFAAWLARELGAFARLHSRYANLAIAVLAACAVSGLALGLLCIAFQPSIRHPRSWLLEWKPWPRRLLAIALIGASAALVFADYKMYPDQYLTAHGALRLGALWTLMMALVVGVHDNAARNARSLRLPLVTGPRWLIAAIGFGFCLVSLDERQARVLESFDAWTWPGSVLTLSRSLLDWDRDGYASLLGGSDCAPWNRRIHPGAREIPDNGIDENCVLGDAKKPTDTFEIPPPTKTPAPLDVVLITVDAFNPDHLGLYDPEGYGPKGRATSPNLDRFAEHATIFEKAYSPGGWTSVAVPALLRGVYPRRLRWRRYYETNLYTLLRQPFDKRLREGEHATAMFPLAFDDPHPTVAELLKRRGMRCIAVTDDGYSGMLQPGTGIERGFDIYRQVDAMPVDKRNDAGTADAAIQELGRIPADRRFFMWVHFFGTHWPDETHPGTREYGKRPTDLYDHEVLFLDSQLVRLLDALSARKKPPAILISADHGEGLSPWTRQHGLTVDEPVIRIPLLARVPGWPEQRVQSLVGGIDLVPTILALTETPAPTYLDGVDLGAYLHNAVPRVMFSDTWRFTSREHIEVDFSAGYDGTRKFILDHVWNRLYAASQGPGRRPAPRLVGSAPTDALSSAVYAYIEENGPLRLED